MNKECIICKESGCCHNCINYVSESTFEFTTIIKCLQYNDVTKRDRGYPVINGEITTNCNYWRLRDDTKLHEG